MTNNSNLAEKLVHYLIENHLSVSVAESCTGGLISKSITDIPGCSEIYPGGVCSYSNEMKQKWLGVKASTLADYGAVSPETAIEMAEGIRLTTGSDYGLSTTGIAGPSGGSAEKPVGLVYVGVSGPSFRYVEKLNIPTSENTTRSDIQTMAANAALHLLFSMIRNSRE